MHVSRAQGRPLSLIHHRHATHTYTHACTYARTCAHTTYHTHTHTDTFCEPAGFLRAPSEGSFSATCPCRAAMAVQQQTVIVAVLALLLVYYLAIPRSGSWTKRPHDLHSYDPLADDEPLVVAILRFPFRIIRLPLTISAWFFEACCNLVVYSACSPTWKLPAHSLQLARQ